MAPAAVNADVRVSLEERPPAAVPGVVLIVTWLEPSGSWITWEDRTSARDCLNRAVSQTISVSVMVQGAATARASRKYTSRVAGSIPHTLLLCRARLFQASEILVTWMRAIVAPASTVPRETTVTPL